MFLKTRNLTPARPRCMNKKMIDLFKNIFWYIIEGVSTVLLRMLKYVPGGQEAYDEVARREPLLLEYVPDWLKLQKMCNEAVRNKPSMIYFVPDQYRTNEAVRTEPLLLQYVPDHFKTWKCVKGLLKMKQRSCNMFLITLKIKGCVKGLLNMNQTPQNLYHNPGQNIWNKIEKYSKTGPAKKHLISTFACFFTCYCQSLISGRETGHWAMSQPKFEIFLIFSYFLKS